MNADALPIPAAVVSLAAALAVGLLLGLERGWRERERADGGRVAGLRTFALIGLLGGVLGLLASPLGPLPLSAGLLGLALLGAVAYRETVHHQGSLSATTAVATLLCLALGALAGSGQAALAIGAAVVAAVLLDLRQTLHRWLRLIEQRELSAALQMLVLSLVVLPLLPDRGYGPYAALNPYRLWWGVVLVAGLSMSGHIAMRLTGPQRGAYWSGLLGGLASSTAATLALARLARAQPALQPAAAAGALAACGVMFLRMWVILLLLQPGLGTMLLPLPAAGATLLLGSRCRPRSMAAETAAPAGGTEMAPFDLSTALGFGALLGLVAVLAQAARERFGAAGIHGLAAISGLADVDAIVITVARLHGAGDLAGPAALLALCLAAGTNLVSKALIARSQGGPAFGRAIAVGYTLAAAVAALIAVTVGAFASAPP